MLTELRELLGKTSGDLGRFRKFLLLRVFKYLPAWVLIVLCELPLVMKQTGLNSAGTRPSARSTTVSSQPPQEAHQ